MLQLFGHVAADHLHRHVSRAFNHHLHVILPGDFGQLAQRVQLGKLCFVVGVADGARAQAVAQRQRDIVSGADFADLAEVFVKEVLLVMGEAPLRHDRTAARDDAGQTLRGHRHVAQQHARVNGEVVHALFRLLQQRVAERFPGKVFGDAVDLLQRLINRDGANRNRAVTQDPFAGFVNIAASGEVHYRVRAPAR